MWRHIIINVTVGFRATRHSHFTALHSTLIQHLLRLGRYVNIWPDTVFTHTSAPLPRGISFWSQTFSVLSVKQMYIVNAGETVFHCLSLMHVHSSPNVTLQWNHPCLAQSVGYTESITYLISCLNRDYIWTTAPLLTPSTPAIWGLTPGSLKQWIYGSFTVCMGRTTRLIFFTAAQSTEWNTDWMNVVSVEEKNEPFPWRGTY